MSQFSQTSKAEKRQSLKRRFKRYLPLYVLLIPPLVYLVVLRYYPIIAQVAISLSNYKIKGGIWHSPFVGLANFRELFSSPSFITIMVNTIRISVMNLLLGFLPPIVLAIALFDMVSVKFSRFAQNLLYIPHFFSWVVIYNITTALLTNTGYLNGILSQLGLPEQNWLMQVSGFLPIIAGTNLWKELGWGTIIYMAALTSIDTSLYEVAKIDGAGPIQRIRYITLPGILPVVVFTLTMSLGRIFSAANTEQILLFYGPANFSVSDTIGTWVYRQGLGKLKYSLGSAVDMFQSLIGLILVLICNKAANKIAGVGIW